MWKQSIANRRALRAMRWTILELDLPEFRRVIASTRNSFRLVDLGTNQRNYNIPSKAMLNIENILHNTCIAWHHICIAAKYNNNNNDENLFYDFRLKREDKNHMILTCVNRHFETALAQIWWLHDDFCNDTHIVSDSTIIIEYNFLSFIFVNL
jgi:hypothetical protein